MEDSTMDTVVRHKGQVTIPAPVRKRLHVEEGDRLDVSIRGCEIVLRPYSNGNGNGKLAEAELPAEWAERIDRSLAEVEAGLVTVYENEDDFLDSLGAD
jgi:AbrB family looped-hinge helix DNA binding protein